ncbi:cell wall hydrolase [Halothermothrix orenii]|uniref:Cell wall hydrolase SleB n=1 Tax=Halothermothrix orenii (strain H 168 / OCM 544 / DSM 9562) TaxID=373903 RepID=B8CW81_HALOH|nr:cell wall hydrolase [Halothermothrix orenii]ACL69550.1 cell wall hydrolase SleB [Halothermothrix orenii H 168]
MSINNKYKKYCLISILTLVLLISLTLISTAGPKFTLIYVVQEGDTLIDIARKYGVSVNDILEINGITENSWIKLGQELIIPQPEKNNLPDWDYKLLGKPDKLDHFKLDVGSNYSVRVNPMQSLPEVKIPADKIITYHVGLGDTLFDLARSFNTSIGVIMALNNMEDSIIRVGDKIKLPINNLTPRQVLERTINRKELELLARAIHAEARGEPFIGQVAVGAVIINRVLSPHFPDTFYGVIYQPGQFTAVVDGQINLTPNRTAFRAAREALKGNDPTMGALYYYNPKTAENKWWFATRRLLVTIGDHVFAK